MSATSLEADVWPKVQKPKLLQIRSMGSTIWSAILVLQSLLVWETTIGATLTLQVHKSISQQANPAYNLVQLNGVFYSQFGTNIFKTTAEANTDWQVVSPKLATPSPYSTTMLEALTDTNQLLHVDWQGVMTVIDPNDTNAPLKSQVRALFYGLFGNTFPTNMYVYQMRKKYQTVYIYLTEVRGTSLFKVDSSNFALSKKITDAPQSETGYEHLSVSRNNAIAVLAINLARIDIYSSSPDAFVKSVAVDHNWGNAVNRGLDCYPLFGAKDYYLIARTGGKAHFYNAVDDLVERTFTITSEWPEFVRYIPNTHFFVVSQKRKFDFIYVLGTDADSFQFEVPTGNSSTYLDFEFYHDSSVSLMAVVTTYGFTTFYNLDNNFCHFSCLTCTRSMDPTACFACKPGYTSTGGVCLPSVPMGQVDNGGPITSNCPAGKFQSVDRACQSCPTDCETCQMYTGFCLKCLAPNPLISITGSCTSSCGLKEFSETLGAVSKCRKCHPSCSTCDGPNENNCLTCIPSATGTFVYSAPSKTCTPPCAANTDLKRSYVLLNDTCDQCYGGCNQCVSTDFAGTCQTCPGTSRLMFGFCTTSCASGMAAMASPYPRCVLCETIPQGQLLHQGGCVASCPSGFVQQGLSCATAPPPTSPTPPAPGPTQPTNSGSGGSTTIGGGGTITTPTSPSSPTPTTTPDPSTVRSPPTEASQSKVATEEEKSGPSSGLILLIMIISGAVMSLLVICLLYLKKTRASAPVAQNPNDPTGVIRDGSRTRNPGDRNRNQRQDSADWDLPPIPLQVVNIPESKLIAKQNFSQAPNFGSSSMTSGAKQLKKTQVSGPSMESHSDWQLQGNINRPLNGRSQPQDIGLESSRINPIHHEDPNRDWELDEDHGEGQEEGYEDDNELDSARTPTSQAASNQGQPPPPGASGQIGQSLAANSNPPVPRKFQPRGSVKPS